VSLLNDFELVEAAGFPAKAMNPMELYSLAGKIISDDWLRQRCLPFIAKGVLPTGTRTKILRGCSPTELRELRERILQ
jgi:hypothetical protein